MMHCTVRIYYFSFVLLSSLCTWRKDRTRGKERRMDQFGVGGRILPGPGRSATTSTVVWSDTVAGRQACSNRTGVHVTVLGIVGLHHIHSKMDYRLNSMYCTCTTALSRKRSVFSPGISDHFYLPQRQEEQELRKDQL